MSENNSSTILDEIAKARNVDVDVDPPKKDNKDLWKKIVVVAIMVGIYAGLMVGLFVSKNLVFLILVVAYVFCCKPLLKLLQKVFKLKAKSDTQ